MTDTQGGLITRAQLRSCGISANKVRNQLAAQRWALRSATVISTFTGALTWNQLCWLGILHAGPGVLVGGLTATAFHGLERWDRHTVTVLVGHQRVLSPVPNIRFVRTRRNTSHWRDPTHELPLCQVEPALLLTAAYDLSQRAAQGLLAAAVQQRTTSATSLLRFLATMTPIRRAPLFREVLQDIAGGAQSLAEIDIGRICASYGLPPPVRQNRRRDSTGRWRFTDCEWKLPRGRTLTLEIDGGFHMYVEHWEDDIARQRALTDPSHLVIRCTARELQHNPLPIVKDLIRLGIRTTRVAAL